MTKKLRPNTMQQRLGFMDPEITTPLHDRILTWIDSNADKIISELFVAPDWHERTVQELRDQTDRIISYVRSSYYIENQISELEKKIKYEGRKNLLDNYNNSIAALNKFKPYVESYSGLGDPPKKDAAKIELKEWEYVITTSSRNEKTGYISPEVTVGYVDMKVTFIYPRLTVNGIDFVHDTLDLNATGGIHWEQTEKNFWNDGINRHSVYFEAKSKIDSLGELFRQLNTYKKYEKGDYVIVCPDDTHREIITQQGYRFYRYDISVE